MNSISKLKIWSLSLFNLNWIVIPAIILISNIWLKTAIISVVLYLTHLTYRRAHDTQDMINVFAQIHGATAVKQEYVLKNGLRLGVLNAGDIAHFSAIPGYGVLVTAAADNISVPIFKAFLEHEYAHLQFRDTSKRAALKCTLMLIGVILGIGLSYFEFSGNWIVGLVLGYMMDGLYISVYQFHETRADRRAILQGYGTAMIRGLELYTNDRWYNSLHPPKNQRIETIRKYQHKLYTADMLVDNPV